MSMNGSKSLASEKPLPQKPCKHCGVTHETNAERCKCYGRRNRERELVRQRVLKSRYPPGWLAEKRREYWQGLRRRVLIFYGGECACCGENRYQFLAIDHRWGGGATDRRKYNSGSTLYFRFLLEKRREAYRVLCHNCNSAYGFYGFCPHNPPDVER